MRLTFVFLLLILLLSQNVFCQEGNFWFFGYGAGLNFSQGEPQPIFGSLSTWEGCASLSDTDGKLLFYTDGTYVWDRDHHQMPNGYGLLGNSSSAQSSIIVPDPGNNDHYYIFTTDAHENGFAAGLNYSMVDMKLRSGLGDVTLKNSFLYTPTGEKLTAIKHTNTVDYWVVSHEVYTDAYYAYLVTAQGVNPVPVVTHIGYNHGAVTNIDGIGLLRASPDGSILVATLSGTKMVEIMNFDTSTGIISNLANKAFVEMAWAYGIEFSPDQTKLYVSALNEVFQFDMTQPSFEAVLNSITMLTRDTWGYVGQLQVGPNGKIYGAVDGAGYLAVINNPDLPASECGFQIQGFYLDGKTSGYGLPNSVRSSPPDICKSGLKLGDDKFLCRGQTVTLSSSCKSCTFLWSDGSTGSSLLITEPDLYWLEVTNGSCTLRDTVVIEYQSPLFANFDADTTLCQGEMLTLKVEEEGANFLWSDGTNGSQLNVFTSGNYWVDVIHEQCQERKLVSANFLPFQPLNLGNDVMLCPGTTLVLTVPNTWGQLTWSHSSVDGGALLISASGTYWAEMNNNYCVDRDSINVELVDLPPVELGEEIDFCVGQSATLDAMSVAFNYSWSSGETTPVIEVSKPGTYTVTVTEPMSGCSTTDQIVVMEQECLDDLFIPNVITPDDDEKNDVFEIRGAEGTHWNLVIYNRWGRVIYESLDYAENWDGNGFATGTYYYVLTSRFSGKRFSGWLQVVK